MLEFIIKAVLLFFFIYAVWFFTGGVERGQEREAAGLNSLFIGVEGTALDSTEATIPLLGN